ncbi:SDR family NAD(P)-dependent oxidoreductase [Clostridium perfringens]
MARTFRFKYDLFKCRADTVNYCASKFFVSAFTEGLAQELQKSNAKLQAKVLAPATTKTNFGNIANDINDYDKSFGKYHSSEQMAQFLIKLYESNKVVGIVDRESFEFKLNNPILPYAGDSANNQKL